MDFQRYSVGTWVSGVGHAGLILWLVVGWGMNNEPMEFEVADISVISGAEYDALVAATSPQTTTDPLPDMIAPTVEDTPPDAVPLEPEPTPVEPAPVAPAAPVEDTPPPAPPARPEPVEPPVETVAEPTPPSPEVGAQDLPISPRPMERPADRIASVPTPSQPELDVAPEPVAPVTQAEAEQTPEVVEEEREAAAPEETATRIVSADETPAAAAPTSSPRPPARPSALRTQPAPEPEPAAEPAETQTAAAPEPAAEAPARDAEADAIAAALAAATTSTAANQGPATAGPPLSSGEESAFKNAVSACWVVDSGAQSANVTVTVAFSLTREGRIDGDVRQIGASGGDSSAVSAAFESARRAILRCQSSGYPLPPEKYDTWKDVELTFDPASMSLR